MQCIAVLLVSYENMSKIKLLHVYQLQVFVYIVITSFNKTVNFNIEFKTNVQAHYIYTKELSSIIVTYFILTDYGHRT